MTHVAVFAPLDDGAVRSDAVVRRLAGAIALGLIADGEQLPPEAELATSLRVAVVTLREALADLRRRGLTVAAVEVDVADELAAMEAFAAAGVDRLVMNTAGAADPDTVAERMQSAAALDR